MHSGGEKLWRLWDIQIHKRIAFPLWRESVAIVTWYLSAQNPSYNYLHLPFNTYLE